MSDLATAQDYQDCVAGVYGPEWQAAADDLIERGLDWPGEAFWAEWRRIRKTRTPSTRGDRAVSGGYICIICQRGVGPTGKGYWAHDDGTPMCRPAQATAEANNERTAGNDG